MQYRPEIDGLRAVAVLPVVLFHAGVQSFSGGYLGVDIFFVISGYLITSILLEDIEKRQFSIVSFYERRARRILPALYFVTVCCIPMAWLWMRPLQFEEFAASLIASTLFYSNIHFWQEADYFAGAVDEKPLLHTWSLAVEEQFYLFFPLLLVALTAFLPRQRVWLIFGIALCSLALADVLSRSHAVANFYLIPNRAWELLAGSLCAFSLRTKPPSGSNTLSTAGMLLLILSFGIFNEDTRHPALLTLLPVMGTVLIVVFATSSTIVGRILSFKPLVFAGLISYSTYLVHHPIFAFARVKMIGDPSTWLLLTLAALSLVIATITWKFVEQPFRRGNHSRLSPSPRIALLLGVGVSAAILFSGATGVLSDGMPDRFSASVLAAIDPPRTKGEMCKLQREPGGFKLCTFGHANASKTIYLLGDSHADILIESLHSRFTTAGVGGVRIKMNHCEALPFLYRHDVLRKPGIPEVERCQEEYTSMLQHLEQHADEIILIARWTSRLTPILGQIESYAFDNLEGGKELDSDREYKIWSTDHFEVNAALKQNGLLRFFRQLRGRDKPLLIIGPVPEAGWNLPSLNMSQYSGNDTDITDSVSTSYSRYLERNRFILALLKTAESESGISVVYPADQLCNRDTPDRCLVQRGGEALYFDENHLSIAGINMISPPIIAALGLDN